MDSATTTSAAAICDETAIGWVTRRVLEAHGFGARFIDEFKRKHGKTDTRKIGTAKQAARFYRIAKINEVVEAGAI